VKLLKNAEAGAQARLIEAHGEADAHQAGDSAILGAFKSWQDPSWKAQTLSLRQRLFQSRSADTKDTEDTEENQEQK
jgi:hypothetical protein